MNFRSRIALHCAGLALAASRLIAFLAAPAIADEGRALKQGDVVELGGHQKAVIAKLDSLPFVDSEYSRRYKFDTYDNPKLKELREQYHLNDVVAPGKTEFE